MNKIFLFVIVLCALYAILLIPVWSQRVKSGTVKVNTFEKIKLMRGTLYMDKRGDADDEQSKAIQIAEDKIKQEFPNMMRNEETLQLEEVSPVKGRPDVWFLRYDIQNWTDSGIFIMVNVKTGEIIEYQDQWA